jgi:hypothetical protein
MNRRGQDRVGPLGGGAGMVGLWGASSLITSVQYVSSTIDASTTNISISSVDTQRAVAIPLGMKTTYGGSIALTVFYGLALTSNTNLRVTRANWGGVDTLRAVVIEFAPGLLRSLQAFTITISAVGATSNTATITEVNPSKSIIISSPGSSNADNISTPNLVFTASTLTNGTTVTADRGTASGVYYNTTYGWVLEFF